VHELTITVEPDGSLKFIDSGELHELHDLGTTTKRRVSHVEPVNRLLRWIFHAIRRRVRDDSWLAAFTRRWPCEWQARMLVAAVILGPCRRRADAIDAELRWLRDNDWYHAIVL